MKEDLAKGTDTVDRKMLNILQEEFPLTERPFEDIGEKLGISGEEARIRVAALKHRGYIRRIGPVFDPKMMGYTSLLCGVAGGDRLEEIARVVSEEPGVTHAYQREGELDLWFTLTMKSTGDIERFLSAMEKRFSVTIYRFPEKRTFKIRTRFPVPVPED
jgi:DNA-binding Lrp family transcriptional regulator